MTFAWKFGERGLQVPGSPGPRAGLLPPAPILYQVAPMCLLGPGLRTLGMWR